MRPMGDDLEGLRSWARREGQRRHEKLARQSSVGADTGYFTPDADLFRTPPPDEMFVALVIDPTLTRVVLERPAATEVQRLLKPVLAL